MNILITGNLFSLATTLAKEFSKEKNKIVIASKNAKTSFETLNKKITAHSVNLAESISIDVLASYKFDVAIFISTREEQLSGDISEGNGQLLDGLKNTLDICKRTGVKNMIYISSTEVYGDMDDALETETPQPVSINGYALFAGEQYCKHYREKYGLNTTIVRVPYVYGPDEKTSLVCQLIQKCNKQDEIIIPTSGDRSAGFLHANDVVDFIERLVTEVYQPEHDVINLSPSKGMSFYDLGNLLYEHFPNARIKYNEENIIYTRPTPVLSPRTAFDWVDVRVLQNDLPDLVKLIVKASRPQETGYRKTWRKITEAPEIIKWAELILGAVLMQLLSEMTGTLIQFKYVDFRLLFVVLMGLVYGMRFGIYAAVLASLSIVYTWYRLSFDWALLTHNVGNWFPFVIYFTAGLLVGYRRDKHETDLAYEKKQTNLIYDKYSFLYGVFMDIRALKDEFREQLVGYRDSFGKIFTITRELDSLEEDVVFIKALNILQDIMENENIAIYTIAGNKNFARLEVNSPVLNDRISKSLNLKDYPEVRDRIAQGTIFQNTALLDGYPAYIAPIMNGDNPVALLAIWHATYDQFSLDYSNLLKVISGLIQASLVRAALFLSASLDKMYLPSTKVLNPEAFLEAVRIRTEMKKNRIADFQLLKIELSGISYQDIYSQISDKIRANDIIGSHKDGNSYILLSQADKRTVSEIIKRLGDLAGKSKLIDPKEIY